MSATAQVTLRDNTTCRYEVVPFTAKNTPHSMLVGSYGVAYVGNGIYVPVSKKTGEWRELARNKSGGTSMYIGSDRYGRTQTTSVTKYDLENYWRAGIVDARGTLSRLGSQNQASTRSSPTLERDAVLFCSKNKTSQYVKAGTTMKELEFLIETRRMDKTAVQILDLASGSIRQVYVTETVVTTRLAI